jgi:hypothetical protein
MGMVGAYKTGFYLLYYGRQDEVPSFWHKKKDDLLIGVLIAIFGGMVTELIRYLVSRLSK